jgi:hypothetical protein
MPENCLTLGHDRLTSILLIIVTSDAVMGAIASVVKKPYTSKQETQIILSVKGNNASC